MQTLRQALDQIKAAVELIDGANKNLNDHIDEMKTAPIADAAKTHFMLREAYDELDAARKAIYHRADFCNKHLIPQRLTDADLDKIQVPELERSFYVLPKYSASIVDKPACYAWLRETGAEGLIVETVNAGTLAAYCKDLVIDKGIDPPADAVKFTTYYTTGMSRYKPKAK